MKYYEKLVTYSIKYSFTEDNIDIVVRYFVIKYNYLLKTIIESIPENIEVDELDVFYDESIIDMVAQVLLSSLFPYIKEFIPKLDMNKLLCNYFDKYICSILVELINEKKEISNQNITFDENILVSNFKIIF